jgi:hypothetical protein
MMKHDGSDKDRARHMAKSLALRVGSVYFAVHKHFDGLVAGADFTHGHALKKQRRSVAFGR